MCGRYSLGITPDEVERRFGFAELVETRIPPVPPRWNVAPSQQVPIVVERVGGRTLQLARWGFRPTWMRDEGKRPPSINARAETLLERPMFRGALGKGRCILPADGFYEWAPVPGAKVKQPWHFRLRDGGLFGFAGLYAGQGDEATCAIITTSANELLAPIHNRMPVILDPEDEALWLDPDVTDPSAALPCLRPYPAELMEGYTVASLVSSVRNDGPELVRPLTTL